MLVGYARISTPEQSFDLQVDALEKAGCEKIFKETFSGAKTERKALNDAMAYVRPGDTLVVWRLDRLGRSLKHLMEVYNSKKTTVGEVCKRLGIAKRTFYRHLELHNQQQ